MSTIFCVSGRLKMATVHGGRSKIATICEREGKEKKTKKRSQKLPRQHLLQQNTALCCQNLMKVECQKIPLADGWSQSQSKQIMGCGVVQKSTARCGYHRKQMLIFRNPSQKVIESVLYKYQNIKSPIFNQPHSEIFQNTFTAHFVQ